MYGEVRHLKNIKNDLKIISSVGQGQGVCLLKFQPKMHKPKMNRNFFSSTREHWVARSAVMSVAAQTITNNHYDEPRNTILVNIVNIDQTLRIVGMLVLRNAKGLNIKLGFAQ